MMEMMVDSVSRKARVGIVHTNILPELPSLQLIIEKINPYQSRTSINNFFVFPLGLIGRWTREEHHTFIKGLEMYGKGWKKIASLIKTRTVVQIRTHAQKYFLKLAKARQNGDSGVSMDGKPLGAGKKVSQ
jgi:SHAQKYF class myb-like DNA-binding protein